MRTELTNCLKRLFDLVFSLVLVILLLPLLVLAVILVYINLGSPVLFRQQRPGLGGKPFICYKFRTMNDRRDDNG